MLLACKAVVTLQLEGLGDLIIASHNILIANSHLLNLHALLHADRLIVEFDQVGQGLHDKRAIERVLGNGIVPQPEHLEFLAVLQASDFKEIRNQVLA